MLAEAYAAGVRLVLTVDTGMRAFAEASTARRLGLDLIITDHHLPEALNSGRRSSSGRTSSGMTSASSSVHRTGRRNGQRRNSGTSAKTKEPSSDEAHGTPWAFLHQADAGSMPAISISIPPNSGWSFSRMR